MSEFMVPVTQFDKWYRVDANGEETLVPFDVVHSVAETLINEQGRNAFSIDYEGEGYAARFSAPGYLDCTDWEGVYEDEQTAIVELYNNWDNADYSFQEWCEKYELDYAWLRIAESKHK